MIIDNTKLLKIVLMLAIHACGVILLVGCVISSETRAKQLFDWSKAVNDQERRIQLLRMAIKTYPQKEYYEELGDTYATLKEWSNAIYTYEEALKYQPDNNTILYKINRCQQQRGGNNVR